MFLGVSSETEITLHFLTIWKPVKLTNSSKHLNESRLWRSLQQKKLGVFPWRAIFFNGLTKFSQRMIKKMEPFPRFHLDENNEKLELFSFFATFFAQTPPTKNSDEPSVAPVVLPDQWQLGNNSHHQPRYLGALQVATSLENMKLSTFKIFR